MHKIGTVLKSKAVRNGMVQLFKIAEQSVTPTNRERYKIESCYISATANMADYLKGLSNQSVWSTYNDGKWVTDSQLTKITE